MPRVRGRFRVGEIHRFGWHKDAAQIKLESVAKDISPENELTARNGAASISMMVTDKALVECFPMHQEFFVDFTPIDE
jgi:hypothetical protein